MKVRGAAVGRWLVALAVGVGMLLGVALWGGVVAGAPAAQAVGEPQPGTVQRALTYTLVDEALLVTTTTYSDAPLNVGGSLDVSRITNWHAADLFVTADISGTATLTATVQLSADQVNWTDADYVYASWNSTGTATLNTQVYQLVLSADGTDYVRVPLAGEYLRVKLEASSVATDTVTATVKATLRND